MKIYEVEGKVKEEILNEFLTENNIEEKDILFVATEENGGLFKGKKVKLNIVKKEDIANYIKEFFDNIAALMNLEIKTNVEIEEDIFKVSIDSTDNCILIGKDGRILKALQIILKQAIVKTCDFNIKVNLDIGNYKEKKLKHLEVLTRRLANEVIKTKVDVKMDSMNSYERRYVHNIIGEYTMLTTKSEGEEPNRYVVIKYKED